MNSLTKKVLDSMKRSILFIVSIFPLFIGAKPLSPISEIELESRIALLKPSPYTGGAKLKYLKDEANCALFELSYPVKDPFSEKVLTYELKFSWPQSTNPIPVVLTVPTIEGVSAVEKSIVQQMCKMNIATIIAHVNNEGVDTSEHGVLLADQQLIKGAVALRSLVNVLEQLPRVENHPRIQNVLIDKNRIGLVGLSVGSVSSLLAMAVDDRFKSLFIMGAIGNVPFALAYSEQRKIKSLRNFQMKYQDFKNQEDYEFYLRTLVKSSPVELFSLLKKRNIYQVLIENDKTAPTDGQYEIKESIGVSKFHIDRSSFSHGAAIAGEIMVNKYHLPYFIKTELQ